MTIPPWFVKVLRECESLSLDNPRDRQLLWERICDAWPQESIAGALALTSARHGRDESRLLIAVLQVLESQ